VNDGCARPHRSALTDALAPELNWRDELFGVTREPAVMVYNRDLVPAEDAPRSRFDLLDLLRPDRSRYAGRVATYDIEASGLGYLFAYLDSQQATTFGSLLEAFGRAGAVATCCTAEILDAVAEGRYLIGYNLLGSYALARAAVDPRIAVVAPSDYTLVLARAAMIPRGARAPEAAAALIDFMLSPPGRRALAGSRLVVDIGGEDGGELAASPDGATALRPVALSPVLIVGLDAHKRRLFIELWRDALHQSAGEAP
jgi:iron(III) transport system substrate-binding protein